MNQTLFRTLRQIAAGLLFVLSVQPAVASRRVSPPPAVPPGPQDKPVVVGINHAPPFAIKGANGNWSGLSVELWRETAKTLGLSTTFKEFDLSSLLQAVRTGEVDVGVGAIVMTPQRITKLAFSPPFYTSGLSIAVHRHPSPSFLGVLRREILPRLFPIFGGLLLLILVVGGLVSLLERKRNPEEFGGGGIHGLGSGFWWAAVTLTTVGYGDKSPKTPAARCVAFVWMFASLFLVASFTAAVTAGVTVSRLQAGVRGPADLPHVSVGAEKASGAIFYLDIHNISYEPFDSIQDGLKALAERKLDAFVGAEPVLRYWTAQQRKAHVWILPKMFDTEYFAFAFPRSEQLRIAVDAVVLKLIREDWWHSMIRKYLRKPSYPVTATP